MEEKGTYVRVERLLRDATSRDDQRNDHRDDALHMKRCPLVWQVDVWMYKMFYNNISTYKCATSLKT